jgi:hypothetical protein
VLEYATSELQRDGVPFAVILRLDTTDDHPLKGFVLANWKDLLHLAPANEIDSVQNFLDDLRYHSQLDEPSSRAFFDSVATLGVGPIRTFVTGACTLEGLDSTLPPFFDGSIKTSSWADSFLKLDVAIA